MNTIIYLFRMYTKHLDSRVWFLILFSLGVGALDGIGLSMLMPLLESVDLDKGTDKTGFLFDITRFLGVYGSLTGVLGFMFVVFLLKAIIKFSMGYYQSRLNRSLTLKLRNKMYDSIIHVDYRYFMKYNAGHFITVMQVHLQTLITSFNGFVNFTTALVMTITYVVMAATISWQVSVVSLALGGVVMGLLSFIVKYVKALSKNIAALDKVNSQIAIQALYAFKYIVSTYSYGAIQQKYSESISAITALGLKSSIANSLTRALQELVTISLLITLIIAEVVWLKQPITAVFVILLLFYRAINQMLNIQQNYQNLTTNIGPIESADDELKNLKINKAHNGKHAITKAINTGQITLKNVYQTYRDESSWVLKDINITIEPNQTVAFVGPSGAGKSTMVDIITGLLQPSKGAILFNGLELRDVDHRTWRSRIGYVNQDVMVFDDTLWNNISMYDENANESQIESACRAANIWEFVQTCEEGLQTRIGDRGMRLSGGQKQRLSIARELYKEPELLILDEATSALDAESESIIKEAIESLKGKITVIIIAHRLSTIKNADYIYVLEKGILVERGSYEDLLMQNSKFNAMVELQSL
jgi:ABC-type multidrug transport system fused ATPase/permease subunit